MGCGEPSQMLKFRISLMSALLFFVIANPETFKIIKKVFGSWVSSPTGCPTMNGLVLHSVVFLLVTWAIMNINKIERADGADTAPTDNTDATPSDDEPSSTDDNITDNSTPAAIVQPAQPSVTPYLDASNTYATCNCDNGKKVMILN